MRWTETDSTASRDRGPELFRNPSRSPARNFACASSSDALGELRNYSKLISFFANDMEIYSSSILKFFYEKEIIFSRVKKSLANFIATQISYKNGTLEQLTVRRLRANLLYQTVRFLCQLANLNAQLLPLSLQIADELLHSSQFRFQRCGRARSVPRYVTGVSSGCLNFLPQHH